MWATSVTALASYAHVLRIGEFFTNISPDCTRNFISRKARLFIGNKSARRRIAKKLKPQIARDQHDVMKGRHNAFRATILTRERFVEPRLYHISSKLLICILHQYETLLQHITTYIQTQALLIMKDSHAVRWAYYWDILNRVNRSSFMKHNYDIRFSQMHLSSKR